MSERSIGDEGTRYGGGSGFVEEPAGSRIGGHYEVVALLGRGGMGAVYHCHDLQLGRAVALKRILMFGVTGEASLERFRREAHAVASLNHRNIVTVHEFAEDAGGPYLVMELLDGTDLGGVIARRGPMPVADVVDTAKQVGAALSYAHRRGVVHRDIKPTNLFRLKDGTVKVLDFGLARAGTDSQLSQEGFGLGTLDYASPEQRRDASRADHRSDLFGLGATLYYLATGKAPRLVRERDLPDELRGVVLSMIEDRPEDRPFSVEEALAPLQREGRSSTPRQSATPRRAAEEGACPACGALNSPGARFCQECGGGLFEACPSCGTEGPPGRKFCAKCGRAMAPPVVPAPVSAPVVSAPVEPAAVPRAFERTASPVAVETGEETPAPIEAAPGLQEWVETVPIPVVVEIEPASPAALDTEPPVTEPSGGSTGTESVEAAGVPDDAQVLGKIRRRLIPFLSLLYLASSMSGLYPPVRMMEAFGFSNSVFVTSGVAFILGLLIFAVPSALVLRRIGARRWVACVAIGSGLVSASMMVIMPSQAGLYVTRFLMGMTDAGLVPGVIVYLSWWFPRRDLARPVALFLAAVVIARVVAAPASGLLWTLFGWQGLFLVEALPMLALGLAAFAYLPNGPQDAAWLGEEERRSLEQRRGADDRTVAWKVGSSIGDVYSDWRVWALFAAYFILALGLALDVTNFGSFNAPISGLPRAAFVLMSLAVIAWMVWIGRRSDQRRERRWHLVTMAIVASICYLTAPVWGPEQTEMGAMMTRASLTVAMLCVWGCLGPLWAAALDLLTGPAATVGVAWIYSAGSLAGFAGSYLMTSFGWSATMTACAGLLLVLAAIAAVVVPSPQAGRHTSTA